jgi:FkbM family methyltransferase
MPTFTHSGDLGDIIYSLPAIKASGGGDLILFHSDRSAHGMSEEKVNRIRPLLEQQSYIKSVRWSDIPIESSLNNFRSYMGAGSLADAHLASQGFDWWHRVDQWLHVEPNPKYRFIFSRSPRYWNHNFPWQNIVYRYGAQAAFVGFEHEWHEFCRRFGYVRFAEEQGDFLQLAQLIAGCEMFVGNQSSPLAVAHGLKHRVLMEVCPGSNHPHCIFQRDNCIIGWDHKIELPVFDNVIPWFGKPRDYLLWQEVYHGREYDLPFQFEPDTLVVDLGAHVGAFALSALHRGAKHAICVEPCQENIGYLRKNLQDQSYTLIEKALNSSDSDVGMRAYPESEGTILSIDQSSEVAYQGISWTTLTKHFAGFSRIVVKSDCEGGEYVLCDPKNDLSMVSEMYVETHDSFVLNGVTYNSVDCASALAKHGFNVKVTKNGPQTHILEATR